jgi:hypothetical protein
MQKMHGSHTLHCNINRHIYTMRMEDNPIRLMERQMTLITNSGEVYGAKALTWAMIAVSGFLVLATLQSPAHPVTAASPAATETVVVTVPQGQLS